MTSLLACTTIGELHHNGDIRLTILPATKDFEHWLARHTALDSVQITLKHERMAQDAHAFLRGAFYRWVQVWPEVCPGLNGAPKVLAVGDLHADNFGTWRDSEGRLVWGINDFDEAYPMPYTNDLVRLATSAALAFAADELTIKPKYSCDAILRGYTEGLKAGGAPFVLAEKHPWLAEIAQARLRDPARFWRKLEKFPEHKGPLPVGARRALDSLLPEPGMEYKIVKRVSGLGGLGRQRYVAIANWRGGKIAREAKALAPSACAWAQEPQGAEVNYWQSIVDGAVRCRDPYMRLSSQWIVRRLSPNCCRLDLAALPKRRDDARILYSMGWETANVHLGDKQAVPAIRRDLAQRPARWLRSAAKAMTQTTEQEWQEWRASELRRRV
jgi:hypothetical protein